MVLLVICAVLFAAYSLLVLYYWHSWTSVPVADLRSGVVSEKISVVIPARNEEGNIGKLLEALQQQTYLKEPVEVIVVDDHSTDNTAGTVKKFAGIKLVSLEGEGINSYKKKAIEKGIAKAAGELIVTTDADCVPGPDWLKTVAGYAVEKKAVFVAAPVAINCNSSVLQMFQAMDFMVLQAITGAVVYKKQLTMCNGANIAYSKKAFNELNGFSGIDSIASGDDMLLMYKIWKRYPDGVAYLKSKEAIMVTQPQKTWREFLNQRIRWASKAGKYQDKRFFPVLLLVYLFNLSFLALMAAGFFNSQYWLYLAGLWIGKTVSELPLFWSAASFFNKQWALKLFFFFQPLHIGYTIISGLFGQFGKYQWKGRVVR
ncbi:MAG: glycosyltransferase [Bacteroidota bacterium]